jgi:UDP-2,3-diacylglucosamine hydrolase
VRLLGKIAEITDSGIPVHLFRGNHDIWAFDYLNKELGVQIHRESTIYEFDGKKLFLAHGDGLGPGDKGYKFLKKVFEFKPNQFLFRWLHPDLGARMGLYFSRQSRLANISKQGKLVSDKATEDEMLYRYAQHKAKELPDVDYFIFGHLHLPMLVRVSEKAELVILGDWISNFSYGVFEDGKMSIRYYEEETLKK